MAGSSKVGTLEIEISADNRKLQKELNNSQKQLSGFSKELRSIAVGAGAIFAVGQIASFAKEVVKVRGEFQRLEAVLGNTLGSRGLAVESLAKISEFAAKTPFQVDQLTGSFVKLANQGFVPNVAELTKLGDLASSTGKGFDQLTEAILDAQTAEFERLKEFGIRAKSAGDTVQFTFKGVTTTVDNTSDAIRGYILGLGELEGVSGSMAAISQTLEGKLSNLEDATTQLFNKIGKLIEGPGGGLITFLTDSIEKAGQFVDIINQLESDPFVLQASTSQSGGNILNNIEDLNERLAQVRNNLSGPILSFERDALKEQEAELLKLLSEQSKEYNKQVAIDIERNKQKDKLLQQQKEEQERLRNLAKTEKDRAKAERERIARIEAFNQAQNDLDALGITAGALDDDTFDFSGLESSIGRNVDRSVAGNLGQIDPLAVALDNFDLETLALIDEEFKKLGETIDNSVTKNLALAGEAALKFSQDQKLAIATAVASAVSGANSIKEAIKGIVKAFISQGIAAVVANTLKGPTGALGPFALPIAAAAGTGAAAIFDKLIPGFANGVRDFQGGVAMVGERGPELVRLPKGADVFSNVESSRMLESGGGQITGTLTADGDKLLVLLNKVQSRNNKLF